MVEHWRFKKERIMKEEADEAAKLKKEPAPLETSNKKHWRFQKNQSIKAHGTTAMKDISTPKKDKKEENVPSEKDKKEVKYHTKAELAKKYTVIQLKALCQKRKIKGYSSKLKEAELCELLKDKVEVRK